MFALLVLGLATPVAAQQPQQEQQQQFRLRIAWGGGSPQPWRGSITMPQEQGTLQYLLPLGVEPDDPGSIWLTRSGVWVNQRSPHGYTAVDLYVSATAGATLTISLAAGKQQDAKPPRSIALPLAKLLQGSFRADLDHGNSLLVRRAPGDRLRVRINRPALIYGPGEQLEATIEPYLLPLVQGSEARLRATITAASTGSQEWSQDHDLISRGDQTEAIAVQVQLPEEEGVYNLTVEVSPGDITSRLFKGVVARRVVQFVVLQPQAPAAPLLGAETWETVAEIDPANPGWWKQFRQLVPYLDKGSLDSGDVTTVEKPSRFTQLAAKPTPQDIAWAAYALPIREPGKPHLLEVEYPGNLPQTLGISILEPDAAGHVVPIGRDSGVYVPAEAADRAEAWQKHRLVFWPRTKTPLVLLTNRRPGATAQYQKIRVLAGPTRLPRAFDPAGAPSGRQALAYLHRPLFPETFAAETEADEEGDRTLDSWQTFYQGATRLVDSLQHVGYSGLMLGVYGEGGTIYPSQWLEPNTRFDNGVFFSDGKDPQKKDVLELLFQLFDRDALRLVPALDFSTPLPELEAVLRQGGQESVGLLLVGAKGQSWLEDQPAAGGPAPYYNPLHPRVQEAMRRVVREILTRYRHHPSFGGLALQLSPGGYAVLPGANWGFDDATVAAFSHDTKVKVPGEAADKDRFQKRAEFLTGPGREAWLAWRAGRLGEFYREIGREVLIALNRPDARLYLAGARLMDDAQTRNRWRPTLPAKPPIGQRLLEMGLDPDQLRGLRNVVFLRPRHVAPLHSLPQQAVPLELDPSASLDASFATMPLAGELFFHPPQTARLESFEKASPFDNTLAWLVAQPLPTDVFNRERFTRALAVRDIPLLADGGRLLPLGQAEDLRAFLSIYRQLPPGEFQTVEPGKTQPVTVRSLTAQGRTWMYLANDSPWPTRVLLRAAAPPGCTLRMLGARPAPAMRQDAAGVFWELDLAPFELAAGWFTAPQVTPRPHVQVQQQVLARLKQRINELDLRVDAVKRPKPADVLTNAGFDAKSALPDEIPSWVMTREKDLTIRLDDTGPHQGEASVFISTGGTVASVASEFFTPPETGRLAVLVYARVRDEARQPTLRVAVEGRRDKQEYYRFAPVGGGPATGRRLSTQWEPYIFPIHDLPLWLEQVRVRFDVLKPQGMQPQERAEVWIDSVQVFDVHFNLEAEHLELLKLVQAADVSLRDGQLSDCRRLLQSYWPRFLHRHVPAPPVPLTPFEPPTPASSRPSPKKTGWLDRIQGYMPKWF